MNLQASRIFLVAFCLLSFLPLFQQIFHPMKLAGLQGAFDKGEPPAFSVKKYFEGTYQQQADHYLKYNTAFNGELVRLRNQVDYELFGNINTILLLGKENFIYDPSYIAAIEGNDRVAAKEWAGKQAAVAGSKKILDTLGIPLIILFAPNKASFYPEFLDAPPVKAEFTNRATIKKILAENIIPFVDFDEWFLSLKDTCSYPLVPKYGAHWTTYGAALAADSMLRYSGMVAGKENARFRIKEVEISSEARFTDDDYLASLNLLKEWPSPPMAYPTLEFIGGDKPTVLLVGDSFIWNWYDLEVFQNCFSGQSVSWYYFKTIYDSHKNNLGHRDSISVSDLERFDLVFILTSDPSLKNFGFGFFESLANQKYAN